MRFYDIVLKKDGKVFVPPSMQGMGFKDVSFSSRTSGRLPNPSALDCTINISAFFISAPRDGALVRLSGVSLADIAQVTHLVDYDIEVYAGMLDGYLPLSKHYGNDLLVRGVVWQTSGNWEPNNTTLDIYIGTPTLRNPTLGAGTAVNLAFNWPLGTLLKEALEKFLNQSYGYSPSNPKGAQIKIAISDELRARSQFPATFDSFLAFAQQLQRYTRDSFRTIKRLDNSPYRGVKMVWRDNTIIASDGTVASPTGGSAHTQNSPLPIHFTDLIGQPVWKTANELVFKTIMRGDIELDDYISLPSWLNSPYVTTTGGTQQAPNDDLGMKEPSKNKIGFPGVFQVQEVLHSGQFRQASALSWTTTVDCFVPSAVKPPTGLTPPDLGEAGKTGVDLNKPTANWPPPPAAPNPANPLNTTPPLTPQGPLGGGGV